MAENNGNMLNTWKDYTEFFGGINWRTAKRKLAKLGFKIPSRGAPMIRRVVLEQRVDARS